MRSSYFNSLKVRQVARALESTLQPLNKKGKKAHFVEHFLLKKVELIRFFEAKYNLLT